ncbi:hypothetical protein AXE80_10750 [Wenyingzhuangia fucanilytica]|uniref:Uncharacterized protein n=1 Tax=Wenyingzhuangia fucanilytica TaxID=1790137 RepID=A0A1B1Y7G5_9FLAO|nr:hypothetical protein [Wenyingzhuangia fucanilytica]ANW96722.1 hypothetical protein AXE80_10750 [Wenyingzhuangia fucanilytica]
MKTLYVIRTNKIELQLKWKIPCTAFPFEVFVRSNSKGIVNWKKTTVYTLDEVVARGNTKIIK